eukprot:jgi/Astpho2/4930/Aster-x0657
MASTCKRTGLLLLGATLAVLVLDTATHLISHWGGCSAVQGLQPPSTVELGRRDLQQHGLASIALELPGAQSEQVDGRHRESPARDPCHKSEALFQGGDRPWPDAANSSQPGGATEGAAEADKGSFALGTPFAADVQTFPQPQAPRYISQPLSLQTIRQLARDQKAFHEANKGSVRCAHMDQEFFNLTAYRYYQRYPTSQMEELRQMYAAWSAWADGLGIPSWLGSGTLDGWVYGQDILPWDMDIDLRLMTTDLAWLWDTHDGQVAPLDPDGRYLLRINKHFILPSPLKNNVIDARVVSTSTGLFIDMVGFQPATMATSNQYSPEAIWASKSPQLCELRSIFPLQRTKFAGSPAWTIVQKMGTGMSSPGAAGLVGLFCKATDGCLRIQQKYRISGTYLFGAALRGSPHE